MCRLVLVILFLPSLSFAQASQIDCKPLDPRVSVSAATDTKLKASVGTVYKIAQAGGEIERKAKEEIQNLPPDAAGKNEVQRRWIYLFCELVRTSKDMSDSQKREIFSTAMRAATADSGKKLQGSTKQTQTKQTVPRTKTDLEAPPRASQPQIDQRGGGPNSPDVNNQLTSLPRQSTADVEVKKGTTADPEPKGGDRTINQTMTNSPGGFQIGGDMIINQAPQPRSLTSSQRDRLVQLLKQGAKSTFELHFTANDAESQTFAFQLRSALIDAGWEGLRPAAVMDAVPVVGIRIIVKREETPGAAMLQRALNQIGYEAEGELEPRAAEDSVILYVGKKP